MGEPREISWSWKSQDSDLRTGYLAMDGRMTIIELIEHMAEVAPGVPLDAIQINWGTVVWHRPATAEELAARAEARRRWEERHEAWERKTYARLREKYGDQS